LLHQIFAVISSSDGEKHANRDLLQVVLEHFFQTQEEADVLDVSQIVYKFVELAAPQDAVDILLPLIQK